MRCCSKPPSRILLSLAILSLVAACGGEDRNNSSLPEQGAGGAGGSGPVAKGTGGIASTSLQPKGGASPSTVEGGLGGTGASSGQETKGTGGTTSSIAPSTGGGGVEAAAGGKASGLGGKASGSGGQQTSGSGGKGGTGGKGGNPPASGGSVSNTGGAAGSPGSGGAGPTTGTGNCAEIKTTIPAANGSELLTTTQVLAAGVHDFQNKKVGIASTISCDGEGQPSVFELEDGATLRNVIIMGAGDERTAGNGVVCKGNCSLENVYWEDICEDAATNSKDGATVRIDGSIALHAADKVFQHNAKGGAKTVITNSYISDYGKVWRSCGDCAANGGPRHLSLDTVIVDAGRVCVAGANENYGDTVTIHNLCVKGGYDASKDKPKICQVYSAVTDHQGSSEKLYGGASQWDSTTCKVSKSDVTSF